MKNNKRRILSILLIMTLVMTMLPMATSTAIADTTGTNTVKRLLFSDRPDLVEIDKEDSQEWEKIDGEYTTGYLEMIFGKSETRYKYLYLGEYSTDLEGEEILQNIKPLTNDYGLAVTYFAGTDEEGRDKWKDALGFEVTRIDGNYYKLSYNSEYNEELPNSRVYWIDVFSDDESEVIYSACIGVVDETYRAIKYSLAPVDELSDNADEELRGGLDLERGKSKDLYLYLATYKNIDERHSTLVSFEPIDSETTFICSDDPSDDPEASNEEYNPGNINSGKYIYIKNIGENRFSIVYNNTNEEDNSYHDFKLFIRDTEYSDEPILRINGFNTLRDESGSCGDNAYYNLCEYSDDSGNMMYDIRIGGTGAIKDYGNGSDAPWSSKASAIDDIQIDEGITSIGNNAFQNLGVEGDMYFGNHIKRIGEYAFDSASLHYATFDGTEKLGRYSFANCVDLREVYLEDSNITAIPEGCFSGCRSLRWVTLPDNIDRIDVSAFPEEIMFSVRKGSKTETALKNIGVLDENIDYRGYIGDCGAEGSNVTYEFNYSEDRTLYIRGNGAMEDYTKFSDTPWAMNEFLWDIRNIVVEDGVTTIGNRAFANIENLIGVEVAPSVTSIGDYAFQNSGIEYIEGAANVTAIGKNAFSGCIWIGSIEIPEGVSQIKAGTFLNCERLGYVWLPKSLTNIANNAFSGCSNIENVRYAGTKEEREANLTIGLNNNYLEKAAWKYDFSGLIKAETRYAAAGSTVRVPVTLVKNPGVISMKISLDYDENVFDLVEVINGRVFSDESMMANIKSDNPFKTILWSNSLNSENNITEDETLVTLVFNVKEGVALGDYQIEILCDADTGVNASVQPVGFKSESGIVKVEDFIYGDFTKDNKVDINDAAFLKYYIANYPGYASLNPWQGDVNGDGEVTLADLVILERHLANWNGYETLPCYKTSEGGAV